MAERVSDEHLARLVSACGGTSRTTLEDYALDLRDARATIVELTAEIECGATGLKAQLEAARATIAKLEAENAKLRDLDRLSTIIIDGMDEMADGAEKSIRLENEIVALQGALVTAEATGMERAAKIADAQAATDRELFKRGVVPKAEAALCITTAKQIAAAIRAAIPTETTKTGGEG